MSVSEYIHVILSVLKDFKVIITVVLMILIVAFAKYITNYKKKAKKKIVKVKPAPAPAPEKQESEENKEEA